MAYFAVKSLSFIIPVFNVEKYLAKCLDSIIMGNSFTGQVICVNDGSTDGSAAILEQYAKQYPNVEIITQPNAGLSAARNAGVRAAKGEYICFLDSDDYWEPNVLDGLMAQIERDKLDVLRFNYQNVNERYELFLPYKDAKRDVDYSESVTDGETFLNERLGPMCYAVMFIIRRDLQLDCAFKEGVYFEDTEWAPRMLLRANRVASTKKIVYNYLWRTGSITLPTNQQKREKLVQDKLSLLRGFQEQRALVDDPTWFAGMTTGTVMSILDLLITMPKSQRKFYQQKLMDLHVFPLTVNEEKLLSHRIKIHIANISISLYCVLMQILRKSHE